MVTAAPNATIRQVITGESAEAGVVFNEIVPGSPAARFGLQAGDVVVRLNGVDDPGRAEMTAIIQNASELELVVQRGEARINVNRPWPPADTEGPPLLGVQMAPRELIELPPVGLGSAVVQTTGFLVRVVPESVAGFVRAFGQTFAGQRSAEVVGPVGMAGLAGQATQGGIIPILTFAGIINFSLAIFNLLPIPGLDGGRILLSAVVALRGRPFKPGQEEFVNFLGIALLMLFVVLVSFGEVGDLIRR